MSTSPKDAAAVILLRHNTNKNNPELYWVKRSEKLSFLGGFHAFPGGQIDVSDGEVAVLNAPDPQTSMMISGAARELFEELGVLVAKGSESLTRGQRESLFDDLMSGRMPWPMLLKHYKLTLDANDFTFVGRWVTPPFSARRFDTWFFLATCPAKQEPQVIPGELATGKWISAADAYQEWTDYSIIAAPPTIHALKTLRSGLSDDLVARFVSVAQARGETVRRIEFQPNYICFPVRTPTKPPATHTNAYLLYTSSQLIVVDPGSPYEDEQIALASQVDELVSEGRTVQAIVLTHLHPDHVAGVNHLRKHLSITVPVLAHRQTAEYLVDVTVDKFIEDGETLTMKGEPVINLRALHMPGHTKGHLCFHDRERGILLTGDNIVGLGSVLIDPPQGNMSDYLQSLKQMGQLEGLKVLLCGHGPAVANPYEKISEYVNHRLEREQKILAAVRAGHSTSAEILSFAYTDVSPKAYVMAERAVLAHLEKLESDGLVRSSSPNNYLPNDDPQTTEIA